MVDVLDRPGFAHIVSKPRGSNPVVTVMCCGGQQGWQADEHSTQMVTEDSY